jgi:hypothetical protein
MPDSFQPLPYNQPLTPSPSEVPAEAAPPEPVSGRGTAILVSSVLLIAAVAIPLLLHRAAWVEAEVIFAAWFAIWTAALWWFGFHGRPIERDWPDYAPLFDGGGDGGGVSSGGSNSGWNVLNGLDFGGIDFGEEIVALLVILIVVVLAVFVIGWIVPLLVVALFTVMRALLSQSGRFADRVRGRLLPSLIVAMGWAAVYTAPLAVAVWLAHTLG